MNTSKRNRLVEILEDRGEQDSLHNKVFSLIGKFYANVIYKAPKEAIANGQIAAVTYLQITFLASDARRLGIKSSMKLRLSGEVYEINSSPYDPYGDRVYARLDVSRKANNG